MSESTSMRFGAPTVPWLTDTLRGELLAHAARCAPQECCGLVYLPHGHTEAAYLPARNLASEPLEEFRMDGEAWALAEDHGELLAVVHSHPNASANPSDADGVACERGTLPWLIVGWPSGCIVQLTPSGWRAPLVGRSFCFGLLDCWALVRDWYERELGVVLPDFERHDRFWLPQDGQPAQDLFAQHMAAAGFSYVDARDLRRGDVLAMRIQSREIDNHLAVWLGDGRFLHAQPGRLSSVDMWHEAWQRRTYRVGRHASQMETMP